MGMTMPGSETVVVSISHLEAELERLLLKYLNVSIHMPGSTAHKNTHLADDVVLIQAWQEKGSTTH
jgi:hypothetical protein